VPIVTSNVKAGSRYGKRVPRNPTREAVIDRLVELLKGERLQQKLSLNEVATRAGLSHTMVLRVEKRERVPTIDTLLRMAEALEVSLSSVLREAEKAARQKEV
jgi:transcriptional regulator with XRE-family HTH domain